VALLKYEKEFGGMEGIYDAFRTTFGWWNRKSQGQSVGHLLKQAGYGQADFEKGGKLWRDIEKLDIGRVSSSWDLGPMSSESVALGKALSKAAGVDISPGVRGVSRQPGMPGRRFHRGQAGNFRYDIPGAPKGGIQLPFVEYQVGGKGSSTFLQVPQAIEHKGMNLIAGDHRGMAYSSVPHWAVPTKGGAGYTVISYNEGISLWMLGGNKVKNIHGQFVDIDDFKGLAQRLHEVHGDRKAVDDLVKASDVFIRGTWDRVTGSQSTMRQGQLHSWSVLPINFAAETAFGGRERITIEEAQETLTKMRASGIDAFAGSQDAVAKHLRFQMGNVPQQFDIFGGMGLGYPMERKFMSRFKTPTMTQRALRIAEKNKVFGILPRTAGLTLTKQGAEMMGDLSMLMTYYALPGMDKTGKAIPALTNLRPEEGLFTGRVGAMIETSERQFYRVRPGSVRAEYGKVLEAGDVIGQDYETGEVIRAERRAGVRQRLVGQPIGDQNVVMVEVETAISSQALKTYGGKAVLHRMGAKGWTEAVKRETRIRGTAGMGYISNIEQIADIDSLKGIPAEIQRQMSEALWITSYKRLVDTGRIRPEGISPRIAGTSPLANAYRFVHDEKRRKIVLESLLRKGKKTTQGLLSTIEDVMKTKNIGRAVTAEEWEHIGVGIETLKQAKKWGISDDNIGLIGGAFWQEATKALGGDLAAAKVLRRGGISGGMIQALKESKGVLGLSVAYIGSHAEWAERWGRGSLDPRMLEQMGRGLEEYGDVGKRIIEDLVHRTKVTNERDALVIHTALQSIMEGKTPEGMEGVREVTSRQEALRSLGKEEFIFKQGDKSLYVPGLSASSSMGQQVEEVGSLIDRPLRRAYDKYFRALQGVADADTEAARSAVVDADRLLKNQLLQELGEGVSPRGKVIGSAQSVVRSWLPEHGHGPASMEFSKIDDFMKSQEAFVVGMTKSRYERQFKDLMAHASESEKAFLMKQKEIFMRGEDVAGVWWRHPITRLQSGVMAKFRLVEGSGDFLVIRKMILEGKYDVSMAAGMKLDTDMDHGVTMLMRDEKTAQQIMDTLNSTRYRKDFVDLVKAQHALQAEMKKVTKKVVSAGKVEESYIEGLKRLVGVKIETGPISDLVGDMRSAAAFGAGGKEFKLASLLFAEAEEGPIGSKLGKMVGDIKDLLEDFVRPARKRGGAWKEVRDSFLEVWEKLIERKVIDAGEYNFQADEFTDKVFKWMEDAEENGHMAAKRKLWDMFNKARKGDEALHYTDEQILRSMKMLDSGRGDINSNLIRTMRLGVGSQVVRQREAMEMAEDVTRAVWGGLKKHWKWPALGIGAALAISTIFGGQDLKMPDHSQRATDLGTGRSTPAVPPPAPITNRIVTAGGGQFPMGYNSQVQGDFSSRGLGDFMNFAREMGGVLTMRDYRRGISPQDIQKQMDERYI
jgi:hypothetical protein